VRVLRVGASALLIECERAADMSGVYVALAARRAAGALHVDELVPAAQTILLDGVADPERAAAEIAAAPLCAPAATTRGPSTENREVVEIPTVYDGPDLNDVAEFWCTDRAGVVAVHTSTEFEVAFCGFTPGFAYLGGLSERYHVPRRSVPRQRVPAGTVALAGAFGGVYPAASPGGWQCLGRTAIRLFDLDVDPPALLTPGVRVRFTAVDAG
jgi:KipI family sensor histidine kinase inhibitor